VAAHVRHTPVLTSSRRAGPVGEGARPALVAKLDLLQPTGSFKVRGAVALLTDPSLQDRLSTAGVIAASGGNFGLAVAWAAARLGIAATVVVPAASPRAKLDPIAALGAELILVDGVYADAFAAAERRRAESGSVLAHAYDQPEVVAGQGTSAWELLASVDGLDTLLVACGGGGLLAGTIAAVGDRVRVVAVETDGTATLHAALAAGRPVDIEVTGDAASSLGARRIGAHAWAVRDRLAGALLVSDAEVATAQQRLWQAARLVAEPGGAVALAALTQRSLPAGGRRAGRRDPVRREHRSRQPRPSATTTRLKAGARPARGGVTPPPPRGKARVAAGCLPSAGPRTGPPTADRGFPLWRTMSRYATVEVTAEGNDVNTLTDRLDAWVDAGLVSPEQAQRIIAFEADGSRHTGWSPAVESISRRSAAAPLGRHPPGIRHPNRTSIAEAIGYVGAALALGAISLLLGQLWADLLVGGRLALVGVLTVAVFGAGLASAGLLAASDAAADQRPADRHGGRGRLVRGCGRRRCARAASGTRVGLTVGAAMLIVAAALYLWRGGALLQLATLGSAL
jgi:threonine dehydratase